MAKRIYYESVKKWAIGAGIPTGVAGFALIFYYLVFLEAIIITGASGDLICAGTDLDPCISYVNFTAQEDIFLYPLDYDPWDRDYIFETDRGLKEWKMYRSWGTGWREINLYKTCQYTWCGAPPDSTDNKYSFAFREDRDYQIKIVSYKNSEEEDVKWTFGPLDPVYFGTDLIKTYDLETREVSITNKLNESIAGVTLKTETSIKVHTGEGKQIAELEFDSIDDNENVLEEIESYDYYTMVEQEREFTYKYKNLVGIKEVDDFGEVCNILLNKTIVCSDGIIGSHFEDTYEWIELNGTDIPKGITTIGIFTDVEDGDRIEVIPTYYGVRIDEWFDFEAYTRFEWQMDIDTDPGNWGANWHAQTFIPGFVGPADADYNVVGVQISATINAGVDLIEVYLVETNGTTPNINTSEAVWLTSNTTCFKDTGIYHNCTLPDYTLVNGTNYALAISTVTGDASHQNAVNAHTGNLYNTPNGTAFNSPNSGGTWLTNYPNDFFFEFFGEVVLPPAQTFNITLKLEDAESNLNAELGSIVNVTANITDEKNIYVDIDDYRYGIDYGNATNITSFYFNISDFREDELNDSSTIKNMSFVGPQNRTFYIESHQYADFVNFTINISGYIHNMTYPTNVKIYLNDSLSNDIGLLFTGTLSLDELNTTETIKNVSFRGDVTSTVFTSIPKSATMYSASMNLSGFYNDTISYNETYETADAGGIINLSLWRNNSLQEETGGVMWDINVTQRNHLCGNVTVGVVNTDATNLLDFNTTNMPPLERIQNITMNVYMFNTQSGNPIIDANLTVLGKSIYEMSQDSTENHTLIFARNYSDRTMFDWYEDNVYQGNFTPYVNELRMYLSITTVSGASDSGRIFGCFDWIYVDEYPYPQDPSLEVGIVDGVTEWNWDGVFNVSNNRTADFNKSIETFLDTCTADSEGYCDVPFYFIVKKGGVIQVHNIEINYTSNPNPIYLDLNLVKAFFGNMTGFSYLPIKFESTKNGTVQVDDIRFDYVGGNKTYEILAHDYDYSKNKTYNVTYYYSKWDYAFPRFIDFLEFIPSTSSSKNVSPYGQTPNTPIFNLTMFNYGGRNMNISLSLNETFACVNLTMGTNSTKVAGTQLNDSWFDFGTDLEYLNNTNLWMWADYECSGTSWSWWFPELYARGCCTDCDVCSEETQ